MQRNEVVELLRNLEPALRAEGVAHVALFGSRARGDNQSDSDIDLLVDVDPGTRFSILNLVGIEQIVSDATGLAANAFMRRSLDDTFQTSIARDVVDVF